MAGLHAVVEPMWRGGGLHEGQLALAFKDSLLAFLTCVFIFPSRDIITTFDNFKNGIDLGLAKILILNIVVQDATETFVLELVEPGIQLVEEAVLLTNIRAGVGIIFYP